MTYPEIVEFHKMNRDLYKKRFGDMTPEEVYSYLNPPCNCRACVEGRKRMAK